MALPVVAFTRSAVIAAFRDVLFEKTFQNLTAIAHQSQQEPVFNSRHFQCSGTGILDFDGLQKRFGFAVAFSLRVLEFFLLAG